MTLGELRRSDTGRTAKVRHWGETRLSDQTHWEIGETRLQVRYWEVGETFRSDPEGRVETRLSGQTFGSEGRVETRLSGQTLGYWEDKHFHGSFRPVTGRLEDGTFRRHWKTVLGQIVGEGWTESFRSDTERN